MFNTLLSGKLDLEKERIKAANKVRSIKTYNFNGELDNIVLTNIASGDPADGLGFDLTQFDLTSLDKENFGAATFVTDIKSAMHLIANEQATNGQIPDANKVFDLAWKEVKPKYGMESKKMMNIMEALIPKAWEKFFGVEDKFETKIQRKSNMKKTKTTTQAQVEAAMRRHSLTKEEVLEKLLEKGYDISGII